jgi:hypothetical protein
MCKSKKLNDNKLAKNLLLKEIQSVKKLDINYIIDHT